MRWACFRSELTGRGRRADVSRIIIVQGGINMRSLNNTKIIDYALSHKKEFITETIKRSINSHWNELGGTPGRPVSDLEHVGDGYRIRYEQGSIYAKGSEGPIAWVYGWIGKKYEELDGPQGWLGFPITDEEPFSDGGRVSSFENGEIYWWEDVGAIELDKVTVYYTGLHCFGETDNDQLSWSDEPYAAIGVLSPDANNSITMTPLYGGVDAGDGFSDYINLYEGKPLGINISVLLMEHDEDNPDKYKAAMATSVGTAATSLIALIGAIPGPGPALAAIAAPLLLAVAPTVSEELNSLLDFEDDILGYPTFTVTAKQMVVLGAAKEYFSENGISFSVDSPLISRFGASYKVYFGIDRSSV
ncbi:LGFP repeat-containing protein [Brevibacillus halotolerans]|uniref:LGFP repeat-containing protein n=1 Tax=Brevibacillus halotolerans TaxID=1507437 RepID=UPI0015EE4C60|nr:hypothetical protein [Brevibacillus halotolerans]MBA4535220.1 hypothetical protein [Brevibacillus halotolerans]